MSIIAEETAIIAEWELPDVSQTSSAGVPVNMFLKWTQRCIQFTKFHSLFYKKNKCSLKLWIPFFPIFIKKIFLFFICKNNYKQFSKCFNYNKIVLNMSKIKILQSSLCRKLSIVCLSQFTFKLTEKWSRCVEINILKKL